MTASIQQLRSQAEAGIASGVQTANTALQQIAQINQQLVSHRRTRHGHAGGSTRPGRHAARATDERECRAEFGQQQISVFTGTGQQLVAGTQAAQLSLQRCRYAVRDLAMERHSQPGYRRHHHVDVARRHHDRFGRHECHSVGPDRRLPADARHHFAAGAEQLDEMANQMSQALSNQTTSRHPVTSGRRLDLVSTSAPLARATPFSSLILMLRIQHRVTIVALGTGGTLPALVRQIQAIR